MDICDEFTRRCFKCDEPVLGNLNVIFNRLNNILILWNKFQIFFYEDLDSMCASKVIIPEFAIRNVIISNNYLVCVDDTGNVHTTSLKFKKSAQIKFKQSLLYRENCVLACSLLNEVKAICLKYESDAYYLNVYVIKTEFALEIDAIITCSEPLPIQQASDKCILKSHPITERHLESVKNVFKTDHLLARKESSIVVISFDRMTVYGCLFSTKMEEQVVIVKLYRCPSEISDVDFITSDNKLHIIIGLCSGTIINLNLMDIKTPAVTHLNTAIHKFSVYNKTIFYTDGISMWRADNILDKELTFREIFLKNVKDFTKHGHLIYCTTYNNFIYTFSINDDSTYIKETTIDEYCSAEILLNNSNYLKQIEVESEKNEMLVEKQMNERNYITILYLANKPEILNNMINQKVTVYESYDDAISENNDIKLTNNLSEYFDTKSFYFLIKFSINPELRLFDILSNSLGDLRFHIIILSAGKIAKTTTVKLEGLIKDITLLIPLQHKYISTTDIKVEVKIMTNMPGTLNVKEKLWTVLYEKNTILNSNYFINFNFNSHKHVSLKEPTESLEDLILQTAVNEYGTYFNFVDTLKEVTNTRNWDFYVKLPPKYEEILKRNLATKKFTSKKVNYFLQKFTSEDFLKSKCDLTLCICKEKVKIVIDNDGFSTPSLKITSNVLKVAFDIRNFLSDLIYILDQDIGPGKQYINYSFYITVENLQNSIRKYSQSPDITSLIEQFERKVIGMLPV